MLSSTAQGKSLENNKANVIWVSIVIQVLSFVYSFDSHLLVHLQRKLSL
jgi:hypothetical protein